MKAAHAHHRAALLSRRRRWLTFAVLAGLWGTGVAWLVLRYGMQHQGEFGPSPHPLQRRIALVVAVVVWLGFTLVPLGVLAGLIR